MEVAHRFAFSRPERVTAQAEDEMRMDPLCRMIYGLLPTLMCIGLSGHLAADEPNAPRAPVVSEMILGEASSASTARFALLTERGHQFVAYYDASRRITTAGRALGSTNWVYYRPPGVYLAERQRPSNVTGWDSHNYLALALDRDGHLHLSGNMHADPLIYYRSTRPFEVRSLERLDRMTGNCEDRVTYPVFFTNAAGQLLFRFRDGGSGNGSDIYNIYNPDTRTWRHLNETPVMDGEGRRNAYVTWPRLGPDGCFHVIWVWRDTPDCSSNHTLSYARTRDFVQWEDSRGNPLVLPITLKTGEVIDPAPVKRGLLNGSFNLGFDHRNRPVAVYHRYDSEGNSQIYAARPSRFGGWKRSQISDWDFRWSFSGRGSLPQSMSLGVPGLEPDGTLRLSYSMPFDPGPGQLRFHARTLRPLGVLPPPTRLLPDSFYQPASTHPGMGVRTRVSGCDGRIWVLRWESMPANRDASREETPPPSELRLYEVMPRTEQAK